MTDRQWRIFGFADARRWAMEYVYGTKLFTDSFLLNIDTVELIRLCLKMEKKGVKD